jgi:hypothetical protein
MQKLSEMTIVKNLGIYTNLKILHMLKLNYSALLLSVLLSSLSSVMTVKTEFFVWVQIAIDADTHTHTHTHTKYQI